MYRILVAVASGLIAVAAQAGTTSSTEGQAAKAPVPAKAKKVCKTDDTETGSIMRRRVCVTVPQSDSASKETRGQQGSDQAAQDAGGR